MSKSAIYVAALNGLGIATKVDSDGDIFFDHNGLTHILYATEDDAEFMRLSIPSIVTVTGDDDSWRAIWAANQVNAHIKVAKTYLTDGKVFVTVEDVLRQPEDAAAVLEQCLFYAHGAVQRFHEEFNRR